MSGEMNKSPETGKPKSNTQVTPVISRENSSTKFHEASPRSVASLRGSGGVDGSQLSSKSNSSWILMEKVAPSRITLISDILYEMLGFCDLKCKLVMRQVSTDMRDHVDELLNFPVLLATLKSKRSNVFGMRRSVSSVSSDASCEPMPTVEECVALVEKEMNEFDFVEDRKSVINSDSYDQQMIVVAAVESERCFPIKGFLKRMLPGDPSPIQYLQEPHKKITDLQEDVKCPPGFRWATPWEAVIEEGRTDEDGWAYAIAFSSTNFVPKPRPFVRRREWRRSMVLMEDSAPVNTIEK